MTFEKYGKELKGAWEDLRPVTKKMLVKALNTSVQKHTFSYDAHADWELSKLLNAIDLEAGLNNSGSVDELRDLAEVCVKVLEAQTESAEVFIQLLSRTLANNDFANVDKLADVLFERFSAGETAEVIRQTDLPQIRAIGFETLAVLPVSLIVPLLQDPLYFDIACNVLEQQAVEFESPEARYVLENLDMNDLARWQ